MPIDIDTLNEPQAQAVLCTEGPLLVLAGAGSGKTRVLTYRIAHLLEDCGVAPWRVLAITFTNKAAAEMRERLGRLVGPAARGMWVSTFHSMCVRILRADADLLGFGKNFTIYDADDQKRLFKTIMMEMDIDPRRFPVNALMARVSQAKNELKVPGQMADEAADPVQKMAARVYAAYQERLRQANSMDFDDLLMYTWLLLKNHEQVLAAYQDRFRYIMVDEYQDTNHAQYAITKLLAAAHKNIMVVGDDDQSIYSWRGADIRNILDFEEDYPNATVVKLEQNYRSMGNILDAANAVISNNEHRKSKRLFTAAGAGEKINVFMATDERDEGRWIAGEIEKLHADNVNYDEIALFYRTNAQSRVLEDMLLRAGVPYRIVGGTKFFDRKEIRDVMAYLTLVVNPADDMAFTRIVNVPKRGVGKTSMDRIAQHARELGVPMLTAAEMLLIDTDVRASTRSALGEFIQVMKDAQSYSGDLRKVVEAIIDRTGLIEALRAEGSDEAQGRIENIQEFMGVVQEFSETHEEDDAEFAPPTEDAPEGEAPPRVLRGDSLADFIEWVRLRTDLDTVSEDGRAVTLMTVHSAKGLEFDCVFVAGMEEFVFPHMNSVGDPMSVEEERRLAYVAITRARKRLWLTCAQSRQLFGQTSANPTSRFIHEIPSELRHTTGLGSSGFSGTGWEKRGSRRGISGSGSEAGEGRVFGQSSASGAGGRSRSFGAGINPNAGKKAAAKMTFAVGDTVDHKTFGRGKVMKVDGDTLHIKFAKTGQTKKLLKDYAPIVKIG
ncbi:UvrD-helicase domain-containing protein [Adlercreutzia sp. ZJ304]|uniref:ATP-dependent helicase n=1 Tax=Adlercreutzia sp. ZJ304 TaxID=2709791 RepID=UPI0013EA97EA|nr:UvrD-helicase domain-containing protein [Adlercreutzia sp. ZJ304]